MHSCHLVSFLQVLGFIVQGGGSLQPDVLHAVDFLLSEMDFPPGTIVAYAECNEVCETLDSKEELIIDNRLSLIDNRFQTRIDNQAQT